MASFAPARAFARAPRLLLALALATAGVGCGGDDPVAPARPTMTLGATSAAPMSIVPATITGRALPTSGLRARVGADTAAVHRIDDSTLAILVPSAAAVGTHPVSIAAGADTLTASLQVTAAPSIADPAAYVTTALDGIATTMTALEAEFAAADAALLDTAQLRGDIARARTLADSARRVFANATPAQRAEVAQFLAANAEIFGIGSGAAAAPAVRSVVLLPDTPVGQSSEGSIKCFNRETGAAMRTWEECGAGQVIFGRLVRRQIAGLLAGAAFAAALDLTGLGTVLGVVGGALIAREVVKLTVAIVKTAAQTTVAQFEDQLEFAAVRAQVTTAEPDPEYFVKDRGRALNVRATYRSLQASDASLAGLGTRVTVMRGLESLLNRARSLLLMSPLATFVPTTARASITDVVPSQYLRLGSITSSVTGTATVADSGFVVRFSRSSVTADVPFSFELGYAAPELPAQEKDIPAMLIATPRFIATSFATGMKGSAMCARDVNDATWCWGHNAYARLGDLTTTNRLIPTRTRTGLDLRGLTIGDQVTCGLTIEGLARCWGLDWMVGDSTPTDDGSIRATAGPVHYDLTYASLVAGRSEVCGLRGGVAICWGSIVQSFDTTGRGGKGFDASLPNGLPGSPSFASLDVGAGFACGLSATGAAYCFGDNRSGQLGDGTTAARGRAVAVAGNRTFTTVTTGNAHACALTTAGQAYCWGSNAYAQIGDDWQSAQSGTGSTPLPTAVAGGMTFVRIEAGFEHTCALTAEGKAYCWGSNSSSAIGDGTIDNYKPTPTAVSTTVLFKSLSAGNHLTCGIAKAGGGVYCWGANHFGEVGIGEASNNVLRPTPVAPPQP